MINKAEVETLIEKSFCELDLTKGYVLLIKTQCKEANDAR